MDTGAGISLIRPRPKDKRKLIKISFKAFGGHCDHIATIDNSQILQTFAFVKKEYWAWSF